MKKNALKVTVSKCPICNSKTLTEKMTTITIPHFGEILLLTLQCKNCDFKHSDTFCVKERVPSRYSLHIEKPQDLYAKVIRSSTATMRIPELGVKVEPGPASTPFITNVEGVLERVKNIVETAKRWTEDEKKQEKCNKILDIIEEVKKGKEKVTIIIEDPFGNSAIIHSQRGKVLVERLSQDEIKKLKTSLVITPSISLKRDEKDDVYGNGINP
ncbi:MAG: ZPR1 zinc finger domain-containing protein [Candidatus Baldrarchaeia archaeon]